MKITITDYEVTRAGCQGTLGNLICDRLLAAGLPIDATLKVCAKFDGDIVISWTDAQASIDELEAIAI